MKLPTLLAYSVMALAMCATIYFNMALKPSSFSAFLFFAVWLTAPYMAMGVALFYLQKAGRATVYWCALAILISGGGIIFLLDVIYWHRDAQGAIAVALTPILQLMACALLSPLAWWLSRDARS
ncbi:MAG: hypothetical protein C0406_01070 [Sideroxydans sp.]|nr:hypothetical protein [Sideroxydans sp.]